MIINFQQGVVAYPSIGSQQAFLARTGSFVTLTVPSDEVDVAFSHGTENYLLTESTTVPNAWGPISANVDYWLYWDIDRRTAVRTFGMTNIQPVYSANMPSSPVEGMHWFNVTTKKMYFYTSSAFREVIRVFAAKVNNNTFTPLGSGVSNMPFAGSQAGLNVPNVHAGRIIADSNGMPIRRDDGTFFTSESLFFINGSPITTIRLESNVLTATAAETIANYQVVVFSGFGQIQHATYHNLQQDIIAIALANMSTGDVGDVCVQGVVTNENWNWSTVGAPLWVDGQGQLVDTDPHVTYVLTYPVAKLPVARVLTSKSVIFSQQFEQAGAVGSQVIGAATTSSLGTVQLNAAPLNSAAPVVVVEGDPRLSDARAPLAHTHPASAISVSATGTLSGTAQDAFAQLEQNKLPKAGGTMSGTLVLFSDPTNALDAATKQYVDNADASLTTSISTLSGTVNGKVSKAGDTMTGLLVLSADPAVALGAATKQYVDTSINTLNTSVSGKVSKAGDTMTGLLVLSGDPTVALGAATKQYVDAHAGGGTTIVDANRNVFVVAGALASVGGTAHDNIGIGQNTLAATSGNWNIALGQNALTADTSGGLNVGIGVGAAQQLTTGSQNVFIGVSAGNYTIDVGNNVGIGNNAFVGNGTANGSANNVAIGTGALAFTGLCNSNVAIGNGAISSATSASNNVAIGGNAAANLTSQTNLTAVGYAALQYSNYTNSTGLGANSAVTGANQVQLGDSSTTTYAYGAIQNRSDARDKADITTTDLGLDFVLRLTPRKFRWDYREDYVSYAVRPSPTGTGTTVVRTELPKDGSKKRDRFHQGLIAQEVKAVMDEMGVDFAGFQNHALNGGQDVLSIGYEELIAPMIKAIQELEARVKLLEAQLKQ